MKYILRFFRFLFIGCTIWMFYFLISAVIIQGSARKAYSESLSYHYRSMSAGYKAISKMITNNTIGEKILLLEKKKYRHQSDSLMSVADSLMEQSERKFQMAFFDSVDKTKSA